MAIAFTFAKTTFEDYVRRIAALNDKNTIRFMKKGATKTKKF